MLIGFLSILLEILFTMVVIPMGWPTQLRFALGWGVSISFASYCNIKWNFKLSNPRFLRAMIYFGLISAFSLAINNQVAKYITTIVEFSYPTIRLVTSGMLFLIAYSLHRAITFRGAEKKIGIAIYINEGVEIQEIFSRIGHYCDYLHVDLLDRSMSKHAGPINMKKLDQIKTLWPGVETHMHLMSTKPLAWIEQSIASVQTFIIHIDIEEDPWKVIEFCKLHKRKIGIVWNRKQDLYAIIPYLPHIDYIMILGISKPGHSGQKMHSDAIEMCEILAPISEKYKFETIFDGGVDSDNSNILNVDYIVSSSAILNSERPTLTAMRMKQER